MSHGDAMQLATRSEVNQSKSPGGSSSHLIASRSAYFERTPSNPPLPA